MPANMQTNDQSQQRRYERKKDQHDRLWGMNIELKTGDPTGKIEFIAHLKHPQFNPKPAFVVPPVLPPQRFLKMIAGDPYHVRIDYEEWLAEATRAQADYDRAIMEEGMRIHGSAYDSSKPPTREILSIVGTAPTHPHIVIACRQENPWIIGKAGQAPDPRLQRHLTRFTRHARPDYNEVDYSKPEVATAAK